MPDPIETATCDGCGHVGPTTPGFLSGVYVDYLANHASTCGRCFDVLRDCQQNHHEGHRRTRHDWRDCIETAQQAAVVPA